MTLVVPTTKVNTPKKSSFQELHFDTKRKIIGGIGVKLWLFMSVLFFGIYSPLNTFLVVAGMPIEMYGLCRLSNFH